MKKIALCMAAIAMIGMTLTSCTKEEGRSIFKATTEASDTKTHLGANGYQLLWDTDETESILVCNADGQSGTFTSTSITDNIATFRSETTIEGTTFYAFYPTTIYVSPTSISLPATQEYAASSIKGFPMYAETETDELHFNNLCGVIRFKLQKASTTVKSIVIRTDKGINGTFALSNGEIAANTNATDAEKSVVLDCGDGVSISSLTEFNVYLPAGTYTTFDFSIVCADGQVFTRKLSTSTTSTPSLTVEKNHVYSITLNQLTYSENVSAFYFTTIGSNGEADLWNNIARTNTVGGVAPSYYTVLLPESSTHHGSQTYITVFDKPITNIPSFAAGNWSGDNATLTSITIPNSVESIGSHAFMVMNLYAVTCTNPTAPTLGTDAFYRYDDWDGNVFYNAGVELHIPAGSEANYRAKGWDDYFNF